jgi:hypothetical protein
MGKQFKCAKCGKELTSSVDIELGDPFSLLSMSAQWCPHCHTMNWFTGTEVDSDFKLGAVQGIRRTYASAAVTSKELATAWKAFVKNMDRVLALGKTPVILALHLDFFLKMRSDQKTISMVFTDGTAYPLNAQQDLTIDDSAVDEWFARLPNEGTYLALEGLLSSMIIGAWGAFETLATDLWIAALNANPKLGIRALGAEPKSSDDDSEKRRKAKIKYGFPIQRLHGYDYNLKNSMGSLLRGKWDFGRRDETCDAYKAAFGARPTDASEVDSIFENTELRWLAALRNALVHRGGLADEGFLSLVEQHPTLNKSETDKPIKLDGSLAKPLIESAIDCSSKLLAFVDARINV